MAEHIAARKGKPFFVNFWMYSVHCSWNGDKELIEKYAKTADPKAPQRNPLYAAMIKKLDDAAGKPTATGQPPSPRRTTASGPSTR